MHVEQQLWTLNNGWQADQNTHLTNAELVIYFAGKSTLDSSARFDEIKTFYPNAHIMGCSTGGEIYKDEAIDDTIVLIALAFKNTPLRTASQTITDNGDSFSAGAAIATKLADKDLKSIFILSDGTNINGSDLVQGIYSIVDKNVILTGGLAGDGADFSTTYVGLNHPPTPKQVIAVGFYGDAIHIGHGSAGGWDAFGPERTITRSKDNILYELDGEPALDLYKQYLGTEADNLPGSALLFPLNIRPNQTSKNEIVRTIVGVNEDDKSMIFAGDVPTGYIARLMHGNFNHLIEGAAKAAELTDTPLEKSSAAILISCIGRKLLLGHGISDETEAVAEIFNHTIPTIGFYSYGEICHQQFTGECALHNQTMTITVLHES